MNEVYANWTFLKIRLTWENQNQPNSQQSFEPLIAPHSSADGSNKQRQLRLVHEKGSGKSRVLNRTWISSNIFYWKNRLFGLLDWNTFFSLFAISFFLFSPFFQVRIPLLLFRTFRSSSLSLGEHKKWTQSTSERSLHYSSPPSKNTRLREYSEIL